MFCLTVWLLSRSLLLTHSECMGQGQRTFAGVLTRTWLFGLTAWFKSRKCVADVQRPLGPGTRDDSLKDNTAADRGLSGLAVTQKISS